MSTETAFTKLPFQQTESEQGKLDLNERSEGPPAWAREAAAEFPGSWFGLYVGRETFEAELAERLGFSADSLFAVNGGDEAISYLFSYLGKGSTIILPLPAFGFYAEQAEIWQCDLKTVAPAAGFLLDYEALEEKILACKGALTVLTSPNNPTGEVISRQQLEKLIQLSAANMGRVLLDEAYFEFGEDDHADLVKRYPNLIILRTFSKAFGLAGLRLGYLIAKPAVLKPLRRRALPYNISSFSLHIGRRALEPDAQAEVRDYARRVAKVRDAIAEMLRGWGVEVAPSGANFLLLTLNPVQVEWVTEVLKRRGFAVRRFTREGLESCLRFSIPTQADNLIEALRDAFQPELLCLDVDGTLINTSASFDAVVKEIVAQLSGETPEQSELEGLRATSGFNDDNVVAWELCKRRGVEISLEEVVALFATIYFGDENKPGAVAKETPILEPALWQRLLKQLPVALITGRNRREMQPGLALLGLERNFPSWTVDDVARGKPDPSGILEAAAAVGARRAWMVGDNIDDILAAKNAGALPIGVGPLGDKLREAGALIVLSDSNDLGALL